MDGWDVQSQTHIRVELCRFPIFISKNFLSSWFYCTGIEKHKLSIPVEKEALCKRGVLLF